MLNIRSKPPALKAEAISLNFSAAPGEQSDPKILRIKNNLANLRVVSITTPEGFLIARHRQDYADRIDSFTIEQLQQEASIDVVFQPGQAGGYYGTLAIRYERWQRPVRDSPGLVLRRRHLIAGRQRVRDLVAGQVAVFRERRHPVLPENDWRSSRASRSSSPGPSA